MNTQFEGVLEIVKELISIFLSGKCDRSSELARVGLRCKLLADYWNELLRITTNTNNTCCTTCATLHNIDYINVKKTSNIWNI